MDSCKKKVLVFGASTGGRKFLNKTRNKFDVIAFVDNDIQKHGKYLESYQIISPNDIADIDYDLIVVASIWGKMIAIQLEKMGIKKEKIVVLPKYYDEELHASSPFECPDTIAVARETLIFLAGCLKSEEIMYFVDFGTLLGIVRDGDLIPWDGDVDISVNIEDAAKAIAAIKKHRNGFPMRETLKWTACIKRTDKDVLYEIEFAYATEQACSLRAFTANISFRYFKNGESWHSNNIWSAPEYHFKTSSEIDFKGCKISVPCDHLKYLAHLYGDWDTPVKNLSFSDYNSYDNAMPWEQVTLPVKSETLF